MRCIGSLSMHDKNNWNSSLKQRLHDNYEATLTIKSWLKKAMSENWCCHPSIRLTWFASRRSLFFASSPPWLTDESIDLPTINSFNTLRPNSSLANRLATWLGDRPPWQWSNTNWVISLSLNICNIYSIKYWQFIFENHTMCLALTSNVAYRPFYERKVQ